MKKIMFIAALSALVLSSCEKEKKEETVFKGAVQPFQDGQAWTQYEVYNTGKPMRLSIVINDKAMASLDRGTGDGGHQHNNTLSLKFHPKAAADLPFNHALLDWNPQGHPPEHVYNTPHFDFHFYITTEAERLAIPVYEQARAKFELLPAAVYMPAHYMAIPGGVPQMGAHWIDVTGPEFNGGNFTQSFLYGSYNGKVTFYEPMITEAFIKNNSSFERSLPLPSRFQKAGWYPTKMRMEKKNGATYVTLEGFEFKQAS